MINDNIKEVVYKLEKRFDEISENRKELLESFAEYISEKVKENKEVNLTFICTHNSRRSHMTQIWAQTAAEYFEIPNLECFSGGTEATAFNPRAVKTIKDAGFKVEQLDESDNPVYLVYFTDDKEPLKCFSKVYSDDYNPNKDFAAVMTCSHADENCPVVFGAEQRFPIRYDDPKEFDGTDLEEEKYKERFEQIGIEIIYVFSKVQELRGTLHK
jgi:arsenate reductase